MTGRASHGALPFFMVSPGVFTFLFTFGFPAVSGAFRVSSWNGGLFGGQ